MKKNKNCVEKVTRRTMEENFQKVFQLLNKWMELKKIPRERQEEYYQRLILFLEQREEILRKKIICFTTGGAALSASISCFLFSQDSFDTILAIFFLILGVNFGTFPLSIKEKQYLEDFTEIENCRTRIKKICSKRK